MPGWFLTTTAEGESDTLAPPPPPRFLAGVHTLHLSSAQGDEPLLLQYIQQALPRLPQLTSLDLSGLPHITTSALASLTTSCPRLRSLLLPLPVADKDASYVEPPPTAEWEAEKFRLEMLGHSLAGRGYSGMGLFDPPPRPPSGPDPADLSSLTGGAGSPHLERLTCHSWRPTAERVSQLAALPRLAALTIDSPQDLRRVDDALLDTLSLFTSLTELNVHLDDGCSTGLEVLPAALPALRRLHLSNRGNDVNLLDDDAALLQQLTGLTCLELGLGPSWRTDRPFGWPPCLVFSDEAQLDYGGFVHLRRLAIGEDLTQEFVERVAALPVLEELEVASVNVEATPSRTLATVLRLTFASVTHTTVPLSVMFPELQALTVRDLSENGADCERHWPDSFSGGAEDPLQRLDPTYAALLSSLPPRLAIVRVAINRDGSASGVRKRPSMRLPLPFILRHLLTTATHATVHAHKTRDPLSAWASLPPQLPLLQVLDIGSPHLIVLVALLQAAASAAPALLRLTLRGGGGGSGDGPGGDDHMYICGDGGSDGGHSGGDSGSDSGHGAAAAAAAAAAASAAAAAAAANSVPAQEEDRVQALQDAVGALSALPRLRYVEVVGAVADELCGQPLLLSQLCQHLPVEEVALRCSLGGMDAVFSNLRSEMYELKPAMIITGLHMEGGDSWSGKSTSS